MVDGQKVAEFTGNGPVTLGVRPEDILPDANGAFEIDVTLIEELGAHRILHAAWIGQPIMISVAKDVAAETGPLRVAIKPDAFSFFDPQTGRRL